MSSFKGLKMNLPDELISEYQKILLTLDEMLSGEDHNLVIPALTMYLAAAGAFNYLEKKQFISWVVERIDSAYDEYERRKA